MKKARSHLRSDKKGELFKTSPLDPLKKVMHGSEFVGYQTTEATAKVVGIIAQENW